MIDWQLAWKVENNENIRNTFCQIINQYESRDKLVIVTEYKNLLKQ